MRAFNHALTGAAIGLVVTPPAAALGVALASHFAQDTLPHYGDDKHFTLNAPRFTYILLIDALLCGLLVLILREAQPNAWLMPSLCAFLATSPDLMWVPRYLRARRLGKDPGPRGFIQRFHHQLQWCERPWGWFAEGLWAVSAGFFIKTLLY